MSDLYDHQLHKEYQHRLNNELNIKEKIFNAIDIHKKIENDDSEYPDDQDTLYWMNFPLANNRTIPELILSDYIMSLNNYKTEGNLFTIRYLNPEEKYCEVIFLNPNDDGQTWLLIIGSELGDIEQVKKGNKINLITGAVENIYY